MKKPSIPTIGLITIPPADSTRMAPTIGPVQLKETKTNVKAMKNAPPMPPLSTKRSVLLPQLPGRTISKAAEKGEGKENENDKKQDIRNPMGTYPIRKISAKG